MDTIYSVDQVTILIKIDLPDGKEEFQTFYNVHDLANFLKSQPAIARALGYTKKSTAAPTVIEQIHHVRSRTPSARRATTARGSQHNTSKSAAMKLRNEVEAQRKAGIINWKPGWDKDLP